MKKFVCSIMLSIFLMLGAQSFANDLYLDYEFNQDRMTTQNSRVYLISSFDNKDYVTCYNYYGDRLWNMPFSAKIISWRALDDIILVFSKSRTGVATYLTCIDAYSGAVIWQRP